MDKLDKKLRAFYRMARTKQEENIGESAWVASLKTLVAERNDAYGVADFLLKQVPQDGKTRGISFNLVRSQKGSIINDLSVQNDLLTPQAAFERIGAELLKVNPELKQSGLPLWRHDVVEQAVKRALGL